MRHTELNFTLVRIAALILILLPLSSFGQSDNKKLADSLKYVSDMPYTCESAGGFGCGDKIFWNVVQRKQSIVPILIDLLADTTSTTATVASFGGQWTVGDIAYTALQEIIKDLPTFDLLGVKFDKEGCGYCAYWNHLRNDINNRKKFQGSLRDWYKKNKGKLVWVKSNDFMTCDCSGEHPNGGHFELSK